MEPQLTSTKQNRWVTWILIIGIMVIMIGCSPSMVEATQVAPTTCPQCEEVTCPEPVRYEDLWAQSAHADGEAEAFIHWNDQSPQEVPVECAKCHTRPGFLDFLGADGTNPGIVNNPAAVGTTISCFACHNEATDDLDSVVFPSGVKMKMLGPEALCIQCHQGRASTSAVDDLLAISGAVEPDVPSMDISFVNSHAISGATPFGSDAQGAYQYTGKLYAGRFYRGEDFFDCLRCHDQHSLELKVDTCHECHTFTGADVRDIRVDSTDYDGDGDVAEGIFYEVSSIHDLLYQSIQEYAASVVGIPIIYDASTHPYFFIDTNGNGGVDSGEISSANRYNAWTPRLLKAAYNYNYVVHDPGAYAHNSDYVIQFLYDSLADIGGDITGLARPK